MARPDREATRDGTPGWRIALLVVLALALGAQAAGIRDRELPADALKPFPSEGLTGSVLATAPPKRNGNTVLLPMGDAGEVKCELYRRSIEPASIIGAMSRGGTPKTTCCVRPHAALTDVRVVSGRLLFLFNLAYATNDSVDLTAAITSHPVDQTRTIELDDRGMTRTVELDDLGMWKRATAQVAGLSIVTEVALVEGEPPH